MRMNIQYTVNNKKAITIDCCAPQGWIIRTHATNIAMVEVVLVATTGAAAYMAESSGPQARMTLGLGRPSIERLHAVRNIRHQARPCSVNIAASSVFLRRQTLVSKRVG